MTVSEHLEEATLHQYFDGELPSEEMDRVRALVEDSSVEQARLDSLLHLSNLMKSTFAEAVVPDSEDALFDRILKGVSEERAEGQRGFAVINGGGLSDQLLDGSGGANESRAIPSGAKGIEPWKILVPVTTLAAAAAVVFILMSGPGSALPNGLAGTDGTSTGEFAAAEVEQTSVTVVEPPQGTEVLEVDFGENTGTVFEVEGSLGEPIAVVWINDDADLEMEM